ncbi:serine/threonine protein kinase [Myxococcota bacterium]|nr:serine/threonine protein kinase [Myxococcota bacterium]
MPDFFDFDADIDEVDVPQLTGILQFTENQQKLKLSREYFLVRKIGEGGMGEVHLAKTYFLGDEQLVAVKMLNKRDMPSEDSLQRFQRETQLLMKAKHNNIVKFIDYWENAMNAYLIMEFVDGTDLESLVQQKGAFEPAEIIGLINPILESLLYMYKEHGMHHRDIKPNNIQITNEAPKKAMLIDFGNAKIMKKNESQKSLTMISGQMSGTPGYIAPEVSMDNYTEQDDVFSIACTIMYCLLGHNPFEVRGDFFASFRRIQEHKIDLGDFEGTMIGHWIHINTSYNRNERMTLKQAFHSLERMQRNKAYPLKRVNRRFVEVIGSDKALMQLISKQNSEIEMAVARGVSTTGAFASLEITNPGMESTQTRDGEKPRRQQTAPYDIRKSVRPHQPNYMLIAVFALLFFVVAALGILVVVKSRKKSGDDEGLRIPAAVFARIKGAELVHWNTKLPYYRDYRSILSKAHRKDGRDILMTEAADYYAFAVKHEDALAYEQAELRWKSVVLKAPASDSVKMEAISRLYSYYCKQKRHAEAKKLAKEYKKSGGKELGPCK